MFLFDILTEKHVSGCRQQQASDQSPSSRQLRVGGTGNNGFDQKRARGGKAGKVEDRYKKVLTNDGSAGDRVVSEDEDIDELRTSSWMQLLSRSIAVLDEPLPPQLVITKHEPDGKAPDPASQQQPSHNVQQLAPLVPPQPVSFPLSWPL